MGDAWKSPDEHARARTRYCAWRLETTETCAQWSGWRQDFRIGEGVDVYCEGGLAGLRATSRSFAVLVQAHLAFFSFSPKSFLL